MTTISDRTVSLEMALLVLNAASIAQGGEDLAERLVKIKNTKNEGLIAKSSLLSNNILQLNLSENSDTSLSLAAKAAEASDSDNKLINAFVDTFEPREDEKSLRRLARPILSVINMDFTFVFSLMKTLIDVIKPMVKVIAKLSMVPETSVDSTIATIEQNLFWPVGLPPVESENPDWYNEAKKSHPWLPENAERFITSLTWSSFLNHPITWSSQWKEINRLTENSLLPLKGHSLASEIVYLSREMTVKDVRAYIEKRLENAFLHHALNQAVGLAITNNTLNIPSKSQDDGWDVEGSTTLIV